jgi:hypothetical protein
MNWLSAWYKFWTPIPIPDGSYVRWELKPVEYRVENGKIVEIENDDIPEGYGGTEPD